MTKLQWLECKKYFRAISTSCEWRFTVRLKEEMTGQSKVGGFRLIDDAFIQQLIRTAVFSDFFRWCATFRNEPRAVNRFSKQLGRSQVRACARNFPPTAAWLPSPEVREEVPENSLVVVLNENIPLHLKESYAWPIGPPRPRLKPFVCKTSTYSLKRFKCNLIVS